MHLGKHNNKDGKVIEERIKKKGLASWKGKNAFFG